VTLSTGDVLPARALRVSLLGHYEGASLVMTADGVPVGKPVAYRATLHLLAAYAITSWAEVALSLPVVVAQGGDDLSAYGVAPVSSAALGAPWLAGRFAVLRQDEDKPLDLAVNVGFSLPLGSSEALTRDAGPGLAGRVGFGLGRTFGGLVRLGAELGVLLRAGATSNAPASGVVGSALTPGLAVSTAGYALRGEVAFRSVFPLTASPAGGELLFGLRYTFLQAFEVSALGGPGFGHAPGTPAFRAALGFAWAPSFAEKAAEP